MGAGNDINKIVDLLDFEKEPTSMVLEATRDILGTFCPRKLKKMRRQMEDYARHRRAKPPVVWSAINQRAFEGVMAFGFQHLP